MSFRTQGSGRVLALGAAVSLCLWVCTAAALPAHCGPLANAYGPFDYRTDRDRLPIVEQSHFTPGVESLTKGVWGPVGGALDYVLRAFPNHHRALLALTRLFERSGWQIPRGARYDIDCYFERALAFRANDVVARLLYASYLKTRGRRDAALAQLAVASEFAGENSFSHYNIGLQYLELGEHAKALEHAHRALALGFERTDLGDRLKAAGRWQEPPAPGAASAAKAASAASR
jgi:tetratricopeptide (TPR) repeat protein